MVGRRVRPFLGQIWAELVRGGYFYLNFLATLGLWLASQLMLRWSVEHPSAFDLFLSLFSPFLCNIGSLYLNALVFLARSGFSVLFIDDAASDTLLYELFGIVCRKKKGIFLLIFFKNSIQIFQHRKKGIIDFVYVPTYLL